MPSVNYLNKTIYVLIQEPIPVHLITRTHPLRSSVAIIFSPSIRVWFSKVKVTTTSRYDIYYQEIVHIVDIFQVLQKHYVKSK